MSFEVGQISNISSPTAGKVYIVGIGIVNYISNSTTALSIGQWVCGDMQASFILIDTLDTAWAGTLVQLNNANALPYQSYQNAIIAAKRCAVRKAVKAIEGLEEGCCDEDRSKIEEMLDLINVAECIIPEDSIVSGRQAVYGWYIEVLNNTTHDVSVTIDGLVYAFTTSSTNNKTTVANEIAAYINSFYPQNRRFQAEAFLGGIMVWGDAFDADNGIAVLATITDGSFNLPAPQVLAFGTPSVVQGANYISNQNLQIILNKLCSICKN